jgi:putative ribosome biogenesis GTPase RsgA
MPELLTRLKKVGVDIPGEISGYFPEFFKLKDQCKFNNCVHSDEPKCAVKEALYEIAWSRYNSYLKLLEGDEKTIVLIFTMKIEQVTKIEIKDLIHDLFKIIK